MFSMTLGRVHVIYIITDKGTTAENNSGLAGVRENRDRAVARVP